MLALLAAWTLAAPSPPSSPCAAETFQSTRERLGPGGRIEVETVRDGIRVEVWDAGRVLWSGRIAGTDCHVTGEIVDLHVQRRLAPEVIRPLGALPVLPPSRETTTYATPAEVPKPPLWHIELGAGLLWELGAGDAGRLGGMVDGAVRRGALAGRLELGLMAPDGAEVTATNEVLGRGQLHSLHVLGFARSCRPVAAFRVCGQLGGGLEYAWAEARGGGVFQRSPEHKWLGRADGMVSVGLGRRPGADFFLRGTLRSTRLRLAVEEAELDLSLPRWSAQLGLRAFFEIL